MRQTQEQAVEAAIELGGPCPGLLPVACERAISGASPALLSETFARIDDGSIVHIVDYAEYEGLVITTIEETVGELAVLELRHKDPAKSIILFRMREEHEIPDLFRAWSIWSDRLCVRRYVEMPDGSLCPPPSEMGFDPLFAFPPEPRRDAMHFARRRPQAIGVRVYRHRPGGATGIERIL